MKDLAYVLIVLAVIAIIVLSILLVQCHTKGDKYKSTPTVYCEHGGCPCADDDHARCDEVTGCCEYR